MATIFDTGAAPKPQSLAPDTLERVLAVGAAVLLAAVVAALVRGQAHWGEIPAIVWAHLLTIMIALVLTPTMLLRRRGDRPHRVLGTIWVVAMLATALISFGVRQTNHGGFSFIHIISAWTVIQVPIIWWSARTHNIVRHRRSVRGMVIGALLVAGFFTFPFHRLLGQWLFG
ncbi:hypothetical protein ASG11_15275 [Sphingomonas sp. Leaf357]|uniref:DUF2306 domain-containing protein n=1 Tax=Sphingomonas sp. Leaf357 TaxID=1736350 RepID=UPI0006F87B1F|nr:hypothetical protein [Sphingomonas sp. Leaf357]KQS02143.1 hypothetical protein ASG11_15275 [Sphingomonas sp. Leaf357]